MVTPPSHVTPDFIDVTSYVHIGIHTSEEICVRPKSLVSAIDFKNKTVTCIDLKGEPQEQNVVEETVPGSPRFYIDKNTVLQLKTLKEESEAIKAEFVLP